jgi:hypothetical protein
LWALDPSTPACADNGCAINGVYDPTKSSTYKDFSPQIPFNPSYSGDDGELGFYVTDTIGIGGITLEDFQFGWVYNFSSSVPAEQPGQAGLSGILGIGFTGLEIEAMAGEFYANLPEALYEANLINTIAYSFYAGNHAESGPGGQLLFGGVDTAKFSGKLTTMDTYSDSNGNDRGLVPLTEISISNSSSTTTLMSGLNAALADSGTTVLLLPPSVYYPLIEHLGVVESNFSLIAPCSVRDGDVSLNFAFGSADIKVPASNLLLPEGYGYDFLYNNETFVVDGKPYCVAAFGLTEESSNQDYFTLGAPLFQSAYMVFDLSGHKLSIAQKVDTSESNIVEITLDDNNSAIIPSATSVSYSMAMPTIAGAALTVSIGENLPLSVISKATEGIVTVTASTVLGVLPTTTTTSGSGSEPGSNTEPSQGSMTATNSATASGSSSFKSSTSRSIDSPFSKALFMQSYFVLVIACFGGLFLF